VVDEFQDTSPIQLALFVELHSLVGRSGLGGRPQAVHLRVRGRGPSAHGLGRRLGRGGRRQRRATNLQPSVSPRARGGVLGPLLPCARSSRLCARGGRCGGEASQCGVLPSSHRFGVFRLGAKNQAHAAAALANGIARMLKNPKQTPVVDRTSGEPRSVRPGDIAVLVATNHEAQAVASALHERKIRASVARTGLLSTPEGTLADSALRWLLDPQDSLAAAIFGRVDRIRRPLAGRLVGRRARRR
jgi:ATP-dependent helicase/nuclease subunit A